MVYLKACVFFNVTCNAEINKQNGRTYVVQCYGCLVGESGESKWLLVSRTCFGGYIMSKLSRALI